MFFCFCFLFLLTAFLLLYDTELFWHKYLCFQYLSCLDFTACIRFVKWSCFWVGNTWTLVCKCYLNLCFIIVCGMCVQILDALCLLSRSPAFTFPWGRLKHSCQVTRRPWIYPGFYFDIGRYKGERFFYILKMLLCQEGPVLLPSPLFFNSPGGGKIGDMHGGNLWPLVLCPVFGLMFLS